jgi:hypothetical protein
VTLDPNTFRAAVFAEIPPSSNKLYSPGFKGRIKLSAEGRAYANRLRGSLVEQWKSLPALSIENAYGVHICAFLAGLENIGHKTGKADNRWKRRDASNLYKLAADVVAEALGVDDSTSFDTSACKRMVGSQAEEYIYISVNQIPEEDLWLPPRWVP